MEELRAELLLAGQRAEVIAERKAGEEVAAAHAQLSEQTQQVGTSELLRERMGMG